jgi:hypothetical protein
MSNIIRVKIDVTKIDKSAIHHGEKGKYIDITLLGNRDGEDRFGNHYMVVQDLGQTRREAGEKGPILGNGKIVGQKSAMPPTQPTIIAQVEQDENVPF